ncbi:hypothetical protein BDF21DRAFT_449072 [Thamnidium elegans]|nr:hypothetical protein BDF21DRAFT_449072 [Thamnidium elegans]
MTLIMFLASATVKQIFPQNNDLVQNQWILAQKQWILVRKQWIFMDKVNPLKEIIYLVEFFILYWVKLFSCEMYTSIGKYIFTVILTSVYYHSVFYLLLFFYIIDQCNKWKMKSNATKVNPKMLMPNLVNTLVEESRLLV